MARPLDAKSRVQWRGYIAETHDSRSNSAVDVEAQCPHCDKKAIQNRIVAIAFTSTTTYTRSQLR
jgi:hypothetical protein